MKSFKCRFSDKIEELQELIQLEYSQSFYLLNKNNKIILVSKKLVTPNKREVVLISDNCVRVGYIASFVNQNETIQEKIIRHYKGDLLGANLFNLQTDLNMSNNNIMLFAEMINWKDIYSYQANTISYIGLNPRDILNLVANERNRNKEEESKIIKLIYDTQAVALNRNNTTNKLNVVKDINKEYSLRDAKKGGLDKDYLSKDDLFTMITKIAETKDYQDWISTYEKKNSTNKLFL